MFMIAPFLEIENIVKDLQEIGETPAAAADNVYRPVYLLLDSTQPLNESNDAHRYSIHTIFLSRSSKVTDKRPGQRASRSCRLSKRYRVGER